jgi:multiple sugar transport system substrate-binding protein
MKRYRPLRADQSRSRRNAPESTCEEDVITKKRRILAVAGVAVTATALLLSGCAAGGDDGGATTVKMVLWPGPEGDAMQKVVDAYNADQGKEDNIKVEMVLLSRDDTFAKETTEIASQSSQMDVYFVATYNVGFFATGLAPLSNVEINEGDYFPAAIDGLKVDGEQYALPLDVSNHFLYYRKDLVDALLADPAQQAAYREIASDVIGEARDAKSPDEWDIDDFHAAAAYFSKSANPNSPTTYGTALQLKTSPFNITFWDDLLWGVGGDWLEGDQPALESDAARTVNSVYADIYASKYTSPDSAQAEYAETNAALQSGDTAFALQWSAAYAELTDPAKSPEIAEKIAVAPLPGQKTHVHSLAVGLNANSQHKDAAETWLSYLATPEAMDAYAQAGGIPSMPEVLSNNVDKNAAFELIADHVSKYGYSIPIFPQTFQAMTALTEDLNSAWVGVSSSEDALKNANDSLRELLGS